MKKYLFLIIVICISQLMALNVSATKPKPPPPPPPVPSYAARGNGTATDGRGNVYVTGFFNSPYITFGTITLTNDSIGANMYIVKYDAGGNVLWAKSPVGIQNVGDGITTDGSGNVYVTGWFASSTITFSTQTGTITLTNAKDGSHDMFIVKFDSSGNALWAKSAGGNGGSSGGNIVTDGSENVYVMGGFGSSTITFGATTLTNVGLSDIFIVKYDATSGNVVWAKSFGGSSDDTGVGIASDASGNVYVTGYFFSPSMTFVTPAGTIILTNAGYTDMFIVKYNASGTVLWAKGVGGNSFDQANRAAVDGSGNVYVTGFFGSSSITFGNVTLLISKSGNFDMFMVKYDPSGNVLWAKSTGGISVGSSNVQGTGIAINSSGNVFATGWFNSSSITFWNTAPLKNNGKADVYIVKYNATDGSVIWARSAGGTNMDEGNSVATDGSGNVFVTGYFLSPTITFGNILLSNTTGSKGDADMFIAKYDANGNVPWAHCAGASTAPILKNEVINDPLTNDITIYPNPTRGKVTLSTGNSQLTITSISVFNMTGKEVLSRQSSVGSPQMDVDLSYQPKGLYIVLIQAGDNYYRRKIIVE